MSKTILPPTATFAAYVTDMGAEVVQNWYNTLSQVDKDEIVDTINHLLPIPVTEWRRPEFDKVSPPLVEIRCKANQTNHVIRLYGVFDETVRARIILLNATDSKKTSNDRAAQDLALDRLKLIKTGKGTTHEFYFQGKSSGKSPAQQGIKSANGVLKFGQGNRLSNSGNKKR
jgi:hypothetical protein